MNAIFEVGKDHPWVATLAILGAMELSWDLFKLAALFVILATKGDGK